MSYAYDPASAIMTNTYLDEVESEDGYYLFSEGMEEKYGKNKIESELTGGDNEELSTKTASSESDLDINTDEQPTGGFPPIYVVTQKQKEEESKSKARELSTRTSAVSIMDILKRKKVESS